MKNMLPTMTILVFASSLGLPDHLAIILLFVPTNIGRQLCLCKPTPPIGTTSDRHDKNPISARHPDKNLLPPFQIQPAPSAIKTSRESLSRCGLSFSQKSLCGPIWATYLDALIPFRFSCKARQSSALKIRPNLVSTHPSSRLIR